MPSDIPLVVSSSLGVGVLAGVVSGICYVFLQGLRQSGTHKSKYGVTNPWQCSICGTHFRPIAAPGAITIKEVRRYAVCSKCNGHACRATCGQWIQGGDWACKQCIQNGGVDSSWFKGILTALQPNSITVRMSKPQSSEPTTEVRAASDTKNEEKEVVRDFIERLVGAMLGANLDDTSVGHIYKDPEYDAMFLRYHGDLSTALTDLGSALHISIANLPITGQTPCTAHASLKHIIRRVLRDASNIAILKSPEKETEIATTTTNRTYEDLLATAILNKVIDNYQTDLRRSSSGSTSSKKSDSSKKHKHKRYDDEKWRQSMENPDLDSASMSSIEEWCRSDSSCGSKYIDHMSFTIQQSIEEISTSDDDSPSNQYLHTHNLSRNSFHKNEEQSASREDWQDNWLFSRKGKSSPKPVPVPMLVPNPSTDFRALIGDRDAEDTTDLSETGSDLDETENEVQDIKSILVDSRTIIGGKNLIEEISTEILEPNIKKEEITMIKNNVVKEKIKRNYEKEQINGDYEKEETLEYEIKGDYEKEEIQEEETISEAKNDILIEDTQYPESDSLGSNTEKDAEYTEKYASFPRKISKNKSPVPSPRVSKNDIDDEQRHELIQQNNETINHSNHDSDSDDEDEAPIVVHGSYSEKEREKWRNPIAMTNNPYSKENLDKRLQSSVDGNYSFGRDYYVREATRAAGGRQKFLKDQLESAGHDFERQESFPEPAYSSQNVDEHIFTATPAIIDEDTLGELTESIPNSRPISLALSTDSEDVDVKRVYNIETGKIYKYKPREITKEVIEAARSPEGTKSFIDEISSSLPDTVDSKFDENHNEDIVSKEPIMSLSKMSHLITPFKIDIRDDTIVESLDEPDIVLEETQEVNMNPEMRDSSIKYLLSLVKNNSPTIKMRIMSPPVQEQEYFTKNTFELNYSEPPLVELQENNYMMATPPISLQENEVDEIDKYNNFQSCIDLRNLPNSNNQQNSFSNKDIKLVQEFSRSMSNLIENKQYYSEDNDEINYNRVKRTIDEEELTNMPSVAQLKKMFDQNNKSPKTTVLRTKSHLTTKPEFRAHQQQIHSLTARSLSKDFRRELQKSTENSVVNGQDEDTVEDADELRDIPPCKAKIKYFELLGK